MPAFPPTKENPKKPRRSVGGFCGLVVLWFSWSSSGVCVCVGSSCMPKFTTMLIAITGFKQARPNKKEPTLLTRIFSIPSPAG